MSAATGVDRDRIKELESLRHRLLARPRRGPRYYDGDDYIILSIVKDFFRFGIEPRHLTMYKHFTDREASFFEALVAPTLRQKNPDARRAAAQTLADLSVDLAQVQAGTAPHHAAGPPAERVSPRVTRRSPVAALWSRPWRRRCRRSSGSPRRPSTPPPTPVPPTGRSRRSPRVLHTPADDAERPATHGARGRARRPRHGQTPATPRASRRAAADREPHEGDDGAPGPGGTRISTTSSRSPRRPCSRPHDYGASSTIGLHAGERLTVRDLLLRDAAGLRQRRRRGPRDRRGGQHEAFVRPDEPHGRASWACATRVFFSPNGLDDRGHSTAARPA